MFRIAAYKGEISPPIDPYNPLNLPAYTLRLRFEDGYTPTNSEGTLTQVSSSPNVWDWTYNDADWTNAWYGETLLEVIGGNTSDVTNMSQLFYSCTALTTVALFDTSNVTIMAYMFCDCDLLTSIPLFNTSKATNITSMFRNCYKVESGALALYQQASSQTTPPSTHSYAFRYCGRDTTTGAAELAQIPTGWK